MSPSRLVTTLAALVALVVAGCGEAARSGGSAPVAKEEAQVEAAVAPAPKDLFDGWTATEDAAVGDALRGAALVRKYECNRCHHGVDRAGMAAIPAPPFEKACIGCHERVADESLPFGRDKAEAWKAATKHYLVTPDLGTVGQTLRPSWVASFLEEPVKIRTREEEWMPRLAIDAQGAEDIAAYLTAGAPARTEAPLRGDAERGAKVVAEKGCFLCHDFTGATRADVAMTMPDLPPAVIAKAMTQAPDLRLARVRFRPDMLVAWIANPSRLRPGTLMPTLGLSDEESRDAAAYIATTPLAAPAPAPAATRLPVLARRVDYEEVASKVFRKSCTHCHSEPGPNGDPGPGSTGGFGFPARGVALSSERAALAGYLGKDGRRHSLLAPEPGLADRGGSRLVAALLARHAETAGTSSKDVRGMPMGLPPLSPEDIQLVETWASQEAAR